MLLPLIITTDQLRREDGAKYLPFLKSDLPHGWKQAPALTGLTNREPKFGRLPSDYLARRWQAQGGRTEFISPFTERCLQHRPPQMFKSREGNPGTLVYTALWSSLRFYHTNISDKQKAFLHLHLNPTKAGALIKPKKCCQHPRRKLCLAAVTF